MNLINNAYQTAYQGIQNYLTEVSEVAESVKVPDRVTMAATLCIGIVGFAVTGEGRRVATAVGMNFLILAIHHLTAPFFKHLLGDTSSMEKKGVMHSLSAMTGYGTAAYIINACGNPRFFQAAPQMLGMIAIGGTLFSAAFALRGTNID